MSRRVIISGLGPISGLGIGIDQTWDAAVAGRSAVEVISAFDPSGFECRIAAELRDFKVNQYVPKSYRKATKVMARDIGLAVAAADRAVRDAKLTTTGTATDDEPRSYDGSRMGCHIGAGLIAAELDELTSALNTSRNGDGAFDMRHWGREGMQNLYPLWLLKYLPNMLACHVTIIHDTQGPSNTITCGDTSATLSIGESLRVIQRGAADVCFCGGTDSKINPMAFLRQWLADRLTSRGNDDPGASVRPFSRTASGTALGEGGGILVLEALETFQKRAQTSEGVRAYAELTGFGASQTLHPESRNLLPDPDGEGIFLAAEAAISDAGIEPAQVNLIVPFGMASPQYDQAEVNAFRRLFGQALGDIPLAPVKSIAGNCCAGAGALDACLAAAALQNQIVPAVINCDDPIEGVRAATAPAHPASLDYCLVVSTGMGGQNAALVLKRYPDD